MLPTEEALDLTARARRGEWARTDHPPQLLVVVDQHRVGENFAREALERLSVRPAAGRISSVVNDENVYLAGITIRILAVKLDALGVFADVAPGEDRFYAAAPIAVEGLLGLSEPRGDSVGPPVDCCDCSQGDSI